MSGRLQQQPFDVLLYAVNAPGAPVHRPGLQDLNFRGLFPHPVRELRVVLRHNPQEDRERHERPGLHRDDPEIRSIGAERRGPGEAFVEVEDGLKFVVLLQFLQAAERDPHTHGKAERFELLRSPRGEG